MIPYKLIIFAILAVLTAIPLSLLLQTYSEQYEIVSNHNNTYEIHSNFDNHFITTLILSSYSENTFLFYLLISLIFFDLAFLYLACFTESLGEFDIIIRQMLSNIAQIASLFIGYAFSVRKQPNQNQITYIASFFVILLFYFMNFSVANTCQKFINDQQGHRIFPRFKALVGIFINIFIGFQLFMGLDYKIIAELNFQDKVSWNMFNFIWFYCLIVLSITVLDKYINFFIHFYNVFTHPLSYSFNHKEELSPDYIQLDHEFTLQIYTRYWLLFLKFVGLSYFGYFMVFNISNFFVLAALCLVFDVYKSIREAQKYQTLIELQKNITQRTFKGRVQPIDNDNTDNICTICFWEAKQNFVVLNCGHLFHSYCLKQWVLRNNRRECLKCKGNILMKPLADQNKMKLHNDSRQKIQKHLPQINEDIEPVRKKQEQVNYTADEKVLDQLDIKPTLKHAQQFRRRESQKPTLQIDFVRVDNVCLASDRLGNQRWKKKQREKVGSLPYGFPKEAVYQRTKSDMKEREAKVRGQSKIIKLMEMPPVKQILMIPQL